MAVDANGTQPNWLARLRGTLSRPGIVSEMIGRYVLGQGQATLFRSRARAKTVDETIPDYEFYDRLRRGAAKGYSLGGLFAPRIERVLASWVLGGGLKVTVDGDPADERVTHTNARLAEFVSGLLDAGQDADDDGDPDRDDRSASLLLSVYMDALGLGDQWVIVNPDGSLSVPSPDTVEPVRDELDYRRLLAVRVTTRLASHTLVDEYRADGRTITVSEGGQVVDVMEFRNLIGRLPVVHVANGRSGNETNGHSIHEALRPLYDQYDDLLYKQLDGAKLLGNPLLTFAGMKNINEVVNANSHEPAETYTDANGVERQRTQLNIDENAVLLIGEGGSASFTAPPVGFTADTKQALKSLFLLLLDHTGIPEFIWGNEVASGRASSDTQMTQFSRDIEGRQRDAGGWIVRLCKIWLQQQVLTDRTLIVDKLKITWPPLLGEDEELRLKAVAMAREVVTDETYLSLLNLVEKPDKEVEAAAAEHDARRESMFPYGSTPDAWRRLNGDNGDESDE